MTNKHNGAVPRITQLDALELDEEIFKLLKSQIVLATKFMKIGFLSSWEPEVDAFLRLTLWKYSINQDYGSFGQQLLNLKYAGPYSKNKAVLLAVLTICTRWIQDRSLDLTKLKLLGRDDCSEKMSTAFYWFEIIIKCASVINLILFLRQGRYPTLSNRLLGMRPISEATTGRQIGFSYMTRELLWHGFMELLVFTLPLVNYRYLKRKMINIVSWGTKLESECQQPIYTSSTKCAHCGQVPVLPHHMGCTHIFCYYCLQSNVIADAEFQCSICGSSSSLNGVQPLFY